MRFPNTYSTYATELDSFQGYVRYRSLFLLLSLLLLEIGMRLFLLCHVILLCCYASVFNDRWMFSLYNALY